MTSVAVVGDTPLAARLEAELGAAGHASTASVVVLVDSPTLTDLSPGTSVLHVSRVGCDLIDDRSNRSIAATERTISARPHTILRRTILHPEMWELLERWSRLPVMAVPYDTRFQPLDPDVVVQRVAALIDTPAAGRVPDVGGPFVYDARDLARSYLAATGIRRPILRRNRFGIAGAEMRAGANLTSNRDTSGASWNDFVTTKVGT